MVVTFEKWKDRHHSDIRQINRGKLITRLNSRNYDVNCSSRMQTVGQHRKIDRSAAMKVGGQIGCIPFFFFSQRQLRVVLSHSLDSLQ